MVRESLRRSCNGSEVFHYQPFLAHLAPVDRRFMREAREYGSRMCDKFVAKESIWMEECYREHKARRFQERWSLP